MIAEHLMHVVFSLVATLTAPVLLVFHIWWKPRRFWLLYFAVAIGAVWIGGSASTWFYHDALWEQIQLYEARGEEPPRELRDDWASDASVAMMPMFGWIPGIMHSTFCACIFLVVRGLFNLVIGPRVRDSDTIGTSVGAASNIRTVEGEEAVSDLATHGIIEQFPCARCGRTRTDLEAACECGWAPG